MILSPAQLAAVCHESGHAIVTACPGSGKTRTIIARIRHLLDSGVRPADILAVTFTNNAADEMRKRLELKPQVSSLKPDLTVCTLHSFALDVLRKAVPSDYPDPENLVVRTDDELEDYVEKARVALCLDKKVTSGNVIDALFGCYETKDMRKRFAAAQCSGMVADNLRAENSIPYRFIIPQAEKVIRAAVRWEVGTFVEKTPDHLKFRHVIVDEGQDLSADQWALLAALEATGADFFIVGDVDQSIYRWRGAAPQDFIAFSQRENVTVYRLDDNYRSLPKICEVASRLIAHSKERVEGSGAINPVRKDWPGVVAVHEFEDVAEEAAWIANMIEGIEDADYSRFAVLSPFHTRLDAVEAALKAAGIPCVRTARKPPEGEAARFIDLLRLIVHPKDDFLARKCVNWPVKRIAPADLPMIEARSKGNGFTLIAQIAFDKTNEVAAGWADWIFIENSRIDSDYLDCIDYLSLNSTNCGEILHQMSVWRTTALAAGRVPSIRALVGDLESGAFILDAPPDVGNAVVLSTYYAAKGLEWPIVFCLGFENGSLPKGKDEEEQRRVAFVGITRAENEAHLTWVRNAPSWTPGKTWAAKPSMFLVEAGLIEKQNEVKEQ